MTTTEIPERVRRAENHFEADHNLAGQRGWYDAKASRNKRWHTRLGFTVIVAGALTTVVQVFVPSSELHWTTWVTALLGTLVVLAKGVERVWAFDETWQAYRTAAECMKSERRYYVNAAGPYSRIDDEELAFRIFVERVEAVIASEQRRFWKAHESQGDG